MSKVVVDFLMFLIGILILSSFISFTMIFLKRYDIATGKAVKDNEKALDKLSSEYEWTPYELEILAKFKGEPSISCDEGANKENSKEEVFYFKVFNHDLNKIYNLKVPKELYGQKENGSVFKYHTEPITFPNDDFCRWVDKKSGKDIGYINV